MCYNVNYPSKNNTIFHTFNGSNNSLIIVIIHLLTSTSVIGSPHVNSGCPSLQYPCLKLLKTFSPRCALSKKAPWGKLKWLTHDEHRALDEVEWRGGLSQKDTHCPHQAVLCEPRRGICTSFLGP